MLSNFVIVPFIKRFFFVFFWQIRSHGSHGRKGVENFVANVFKKTLICDDGRSVCQKKFTKCVTSLVYEHIPISKKIMT